MGKEIYTMMGDLKVAALKRCPKCDRIKCLDEFSLDVNRKDGLQCHCKSCCREYSAKYRAENPDKVRMEQGEYREKNRSKLNKHLREYYHRYPEKWAEYSAKHREEIRARKREYNATPRGKRAAISRHLKRLYNITADKYDEILKEQNGSCAICGKSTTEFKRRLAVDHDHGSGKVRGLLCTNCNRGVGNFYDSPDLLQKAIFYLLRFATVKVEALDSSRASSISCSQIHAELFGNTAAYQSGRKDIWYGGP